MELQPASMVANGLLGQYFVPVSAPSEDAHVHAQKTLPVTSVDYQPAAALPNLQNSSIPAMNIVQAVSAHQPQSSNTYTPSIGKLDCKLYFHRATDKYTYNTALKLSNFKNPKPYISYACILSHTFHIYKNTALHSPKGDQSTCKNEKGPVASYLIFPAVSYYFTDP